METKSSKDEAVNLARRGFAVFPIKPRDKTPATEHGFKDASTDPAVVGRLFAKRPDLNVGIATGPASGVWVLDVEAEGIGDLDRLQQRHGKLPETVVSITGGGGLHYLFAYNGVQITNRTKVGGVAIDVRGDGGYIVTPPSIHNSGKRYEWERAPGSVSVAQAPEWLVEWVTNRTSTAATTAAATTSTTTPSRILFRIERRNTSPSSPQRSAVREDTTRLSMQPAFLFSGSHFRRSRHCRCCGNGTKRASLPGMTGTSITSSLTPTRKAVHGGGSSTASRIWAMIQTSGGSFDSTTALRRRTPRTSTPLIYPRRSSGRYSTSTHIKALRVRSSV